MKPEKKILVELSEQDLHNIISALVFSGIVAETAQTKASCIDLSIVLVDSLFNPLNRFIENV